MLPPSSSPLATSTLPSSAPDGWVLQRVYCGGADHLELVRSGCIGVLPVGLTPSDDTDRPCLKRLAPLSAALTAAAADMRGHTLCDYGSLSSTKTRSVMCEVVNHDLRLWLNELILFALSSRLTVVPPPPDAVCAMPPVPALGRRRPSAWGGGGKTPEDR